MRVGAEARLYPLTLRAGFSYISSPYKDVTVTKGIAVSARHSRLRDTASGRRRYDRFSAGLGYSVGNFLTIDAAYVNSSATTYHYLYEPALVDAAKEQDISSYT